MLENQRLRACSRITAYSLSISPMAEPSGNALRSSAARAWNSRLYSTTGGHIPNPPPSEPIVAQPLSKIVAIARAARRGLQDLALDIMGLARRHKAFGEARIVIEGGRQHYNAKRQHSSLGHRPPAPEVVQWPAPPSGAASPATPSVAPRPVMQQD